MCARLSSPRPGWKREPGPKSEKDEAETAGTMGGKSQNLRGPRSWSKGWPFRSGPGRDSSASERVKWDLHPHRGPPWDPRVGEQGQD